MSTKENTPEKIDLEAAVAAFKQEFVKEGSIVLDAWADGEFIVVYVDYLNFDETGIPEKMKDVPAPGEYKGHPTVLTLFPRD